MNSFLHGYGWGLGMIIFIGPVFFTLLHSALNHGFKSGFAVAMGILISDVVVVALCLLGIGPLLKRPDVIFYLGIGGAILLLGFGLMYIFKPSLPDEKKVAFKNSDYAGFFTKGFLVNFVNPFVFGVWLALIGAATSWHGSGSGLYIFLTGALLGIGTTDTLKALFAHKIKAYLKPHVLVWVYRVIGIALIGFAGWFLYYVLNL